MLDTALSLMVLAAVVLVLGAVALLRRGGMRKQATLMLVMAGILVVNVAIWAIPTKSGSSPLEQVK